MGKTTTKDGKKAAGGFPLRAAVAMATDPTVDPVVLMKTTNTACDRDPARCACPTHAAARAAAAPCIYCGGDGPTNDACACAACAKEMGLDAPVVPARRCPDCGEFVTDCSCAGRPERDHEHGYGGRAANVGGED